MNSQVSAKLMMARADDSYVLFCPISDMYGPKALMPTRKLAMVNSPTTVASVRNAPLSSAERRLGKMTCSRIVPQPAPRLCAASVRERTSMAARPVSTAR